MDEDELEKIKKQKKEQLQEEGNEVNAEERVNQQREQIKHQAAKYLTKEAKSRLGNIRAAQPDLASSIEMQIARLGRTGQVDKVDDDQLKQILKSIQNDKSQNQTDIKFRR